VMVSSSSSVAMDDSIDNENNCDGGSGGKGEGSGTATKVWQIRTSCHGTATLHV
jgi:hypothetical protein